MKRKRLSLALAGAVALAASVNAAIIGVNFTDNIANRQIAPTTLAGVWPRDNWNNTTNGASGTLGGLVDTNGTPTTASVTWSATVTWGDGTADADASAGVGDAQICRGYLDDGETSTGIGANFTVTNIPFANYHVVLLLSTDATGATYTPATVNGSAYTTEGFKRTYQDPQWNTNTTIIVTNLTGNLSVAMAPKDGSNRGTIGGFQIVESTEGNHPPFPEPEPPTPPEWGESVAISVNFTRDNDWEQLTPSTHAGLDFYIYTNWNMTAGENGTQGTLTNSLGEATTASVTWTTTGMYQDGNARNDADLGVGDAQLAWGYLDDGFTDGADWAVTGIPFTEYHVVLYLSTDTDGDTYRPFNINGTDYSTTGNKSRYTNPNWNETNTIVVSNLTGNLTVDGLARDGGNRGSVAGFQIINAVILPGDPVTVSIAGPFAGGMELSWIGIDGESYGVETNANLLFNGGWNSFTSNILGTGGEITVTNTIGPNETFYRVITE